MEFMAQAVRIHVFEFIKGLGRHPDRKLSETCVGFEVDLDKVSTG